MKIKRLLIISIITIILSSIWIPILKYIHSKTIWFDQTDCMVKYVNNYYPYWSIYYIKEDKKYPHIDKRWLEYLYEEVEIYGCNIRGYWLFSDITNTIYCYVTYFFEYKILNNNS